METSVKGEDVTSVQHIVQKVLKQKFYHSGPVMDIVSVQDDVVASVSEDATVRLWSASTHTLLAKQRFSGEALTSVACEPRVPMVAVGDVDGGVGVGRVSSAGERELVQRARAHNSAVSRMRFSGNGKLLATAADGVVDRRVFILDTSPDGALVSTRGPAALTTRRTGQSSRGASGGRPAPARRSR